MLFMLKLLYFGKEMSNILPVNNCFQTRTIFLQIALENSTFCKCKENSSSSKYILMRQKPDVDIIVS